jgi:hypothetical protein
MMKIDNDLVSRQDSGPFITSLNAAWAGQSHAALNGTRIEYRD